jgi:urea transport system substrate-binding protein
MQRRTLKAFALSASTVLMGYSFQVYAADTIKVGIMHSLSGTMAISETPLKDVALMAIDDINAKGGVLGKKLEPVVVDPASNWPLFAEKARQLLTQDKVAVFGCWTSVSRKSVLPVFEELNGLLFYPVQYEGEEMSPNVFYTGAAPNQQAIPAVEYLLSEDGGGAKRFFLLGTDYVYPAPPTKSCAPSCMRKGSRIKTSKRSIPRSVTAITRPSSPTSRNSPPAAKRRWSLPSTAIPTSRSIKSWQTRAESDRCAGGGLLGG